MARITHPTLDERSARIIWSMLAEPGDQEAHRFRSLFTTTSESVDAVLDPSYANPDYLAGLERWRPRYSPSQLRMIYSKMRTLGIHTVIPGNEHWPAAAFAERLGDSVPPVLYVLGDPALLTTRLFALVGARAATGYGEHVTMEFAAGLVDRGYTIVSGAAYGIDGMAHRAALAAHGNTIAILAGGVDRFYPAGHDDLLRRISEVGTVVSELPPGSAPTKWRFLQRNRLIAALSEALVVVEASVRSGSLNAAGHAATYGVPLGAVPGPVTSVTSSGCHRLLRESKATCVTTVDEAAQLAFGIQL